MVVQSVLLPANEPPREKQVSTVVTVQVPEMQHAPSLEQEDSSQASSRISPPFAEAIGFEKFDAGGAETRPSKAATDQLVTLINICFLFTTTSPAIDPGEL